MFDSIISKVVLGVIRHFVTGLGGGLLAQGLISGADEQTVIGSVMAIVPILFSVYDKFQAKQKTDAAVLAAAQKGK